MKVFLRALGCRLNEAELQVWSQQFIDAGYQLATSTENANLLVLNSCAVTGEAARKSRQILRRLHRENPTAKIVVTGCYASLDETEAASILGVDMVIANKDKDRLVELISDQLHLDQELLTTMPTFATEPGEAALFIRNRDRAFIKIQDGCRYKCSYCIVTKARGDERSRTISDIVREVNQYQAQGINEVVLTGVHVGGYGSDLNISLMQLVSAILADTDIARVRFASVEPWDLPEQFFQLFENNRLMPHMHLPLQSGCDSVLKRMSRRCNQSNFLSLIKQARTAVPGFNTTTDIIVGFPGESEDEWQQSLDFIQKIGFGHIHIFSYSHREGTRAATFPEQIQTNVKKHRSKKLLAIANEMKQQALQNMLGQQVDVLWESGKQQLADGQYQFSGYTPNYHRVQTMSKTDISGFILPVTLTDTTSDKLSLTGNISISGQEIPQSAISVKQL